MEAIKQIVTVKNDKITIHLKPELNNTKVEVIVLPLAGRKMKKISKKEGLADLQSVSIWSKNDLSMIEKTSKLFNSWPIQNF
jgi:hypothetical protein